MIFRVAIALLPMVAWAQDSPAGSTPGAPPEVDQALRARVSKFFQYHVDGDFRKAYDLVAENTKEEYFNSGKMRLKGFELNGIKYSDDFTKAEVNATVTMNWNIRVQDNTSIVPMITTWKIEDGKWVWYHQVKTGDMLTPMGPSRIDPEVNGARPKRIPDHVDDAAAASAAQGIVGKVTIDKTSVSLSSGSAKVAVHNGTQGFVRLSMSAMPDIPGLSAKLDKADLGPGQDAALEFEYKPVDTEARMPFQVRMLVEPFNQLFTVMVNLANPPADQ